MITETSNARHLFPHPEERRLRRVSKDAAASWFETAQERLLTMRNGDSTRLDLD
jgi:hypothetical protein